MTTVGLNWYERWHFSFSCLPTNQGEVGWRCQPVAKEKSLCVPSLYPNLTPIHGLILVCDQQNFLGPSRSAKNHLHWQQELLRNSRFAVFATFAIAKRKKQQKRPFLHNSNWTASILNVGHFFADLDGPKKFCWLRTKIKGTSPGGHNHPPTHKEGEKLQNWP